MHKKEDMHISKNQIKLVRSLRLRKYREETGLFVAEGMKCVSELLNRFQPVFIASSDLECGAVLPQEYLLEASEREIEQMSFLQTPQGIIGVFRLPQEPFQQSVILGICRNDIVLALDGIQDPGNMGTIIRTADWFGVRHVVCSADTADSYNPKVVQATMGALARVHVHYVDLYGFLSAVGQEHLPIYGTLLEGRNVYTQSVENKGVLLMGNEGNGISTPLRPLISIPLLIPSYPTGIPTSESLNVAIATAITLSEFRSRNYLGRQ